MGNQARKVFPSRPREKAYSTNGANDTTNGSSCWLLLPGDAVVCDGDRSPDVRTRQIACCLMGFHPSGLRVIAPRVSSSEPPLALALALAWHYRDLDPAGLGLVLDPLDLVAVAVDQHDRGAAVSGSHLPASSNSRAITARPIRHAQTLPESDSRALQLGNEIEAVDREDGGDGQAPERRARESSPRSPGACTTHIDAVVRDEQVGRVGGRKRAPVGYAARSQAPPAYPTNLGQPIDVDPAFSGR
jgi:hypothetical protein